METFLQLALSFPTAIFTTGLLFVLMYWMLVLVGAFGFDVGGDGALEGKGAAMEAKGAALEANAAAVEAKSGALEAKAGALDSKEGIWEALGFGVVPGSIIITFLIFWSWVLSMLGSYLVGPWLGGLLPMWIAGSGIGLLAVFASVFLSVFTIKPLKPIFEIKLAPRRRQLLGKVATVSSGRVDAGFGTATLEDGGAGLILNVFCAAENKLKKGDRVLLLEYSEAKQAYEVEPVDFLLPEELQRLESPLGAEAVARALARQRVDR